MNQIPCPVCLTPLQLSPARSRKSKRPKIFLMLACPDDGRHFRGFIQDVEFVGRAVDAAGMSASTEKGSPLSKELHG